MSAEETNKPGEMGDGNKLYSDLGNEAAQLYSNEGNAAAELSRAEAERNAILDDPDIQLSGPNDYDGTDRTNSGVRVDSLTSKILGAEQDLRDNRSEAKEFARKNIDQLQAEAQKEAEDDGVEINRGQLDA